MNLALASDLIELKVIDAAPINNSGGQSNDAIGVYLDHQSSQKFEEWTGRYVGKVINVLLDGHITLQPTLFTAITGGALVIVRIPADKLAETASKLKEGKMMLTVEVKD